MIGEILKGAVEISKEVAKDSKEKTKSYNPDKRIDANKETRKSGKSETKYNPDKRLESPKKEIKNLAERYIKELKKYSDVSSTLKDVNLDTKDIKNVPKEEVANRRKEFNQNKANLIRQWEIKNGKEWPRYKKDVINENGIVERKAGQLYDAHHIQPLSMNGKNEVSNITPLRVDDHRMIHAKGGTLDSLTSKVEEIQK